MVISILLFHVRRTPLGQRAQRFIFSRWRNEYKVCNEIKQSSLLLQTTQNSCILMAAALEFNAELKGL